MNIEKLAIEKGAHKFRRHGDIGYSFEFTQPDLEAFAKALANSPQVDGMVLVPTDPTKEMMEAVWIAYLNRQGDIDFEESAIYFYKAMLSAYKPQADDVRKDEG